MEADVCLHFEHSCRRNTYARTHAPNKENTFRRILEKLTFARRRRRNFWPMSLHVPFAENALFQ